MQFKKFFFYINILFIVTFFSCSEPNVQKSNSNIKFGKYGNEIIQIYEWEYKDHKYLIAKGDNTKFSITHAGHCTCNKIVNK